MKGRKRNSSNESSDRGASVIIDLSNEQAQSVAREVSSHRTAKKTKKIYKGKLNKWIDYYTKSSPEVISEDIDENGSIKVSVNLNVLNIEHILAFLGNETKDAIEVQNSATMPGTEDFIEFAATKTVYAYQTISGHISALKSEYRDAKIDLPIGVKKELDEFLGGYKKIIADLKSQGKYAIEEGKRCIRFEGYRHLLGLFQKYSPYSEEEYLRKHFQIGTFCSIFIILLWNLAQRSETISSIHLEHIKWVGDSLCIKIPKTKNDQMGDKSDADDDGKHIYANPNNPILCPISNLGIYLFTTPRACNKLFSGDSQHVRYGSGLRELLRSLEKSKSELLKKICDAIENIGTHSFRKGAATYALQFAGVYQLSDVYIRVGWSLGNVQDRYIFQTPGGDQCLGRVLDGLSPHSDKFALLPPHFDPVDLAQLTEADWCDVYPSYSLLPASFKDVMPFLLDSLYFHESFYRTIFHTNHPLFLSAAFQCHNQKIVAIKQKIYCEVNECLTTGLIASGIPHVLQLAIRVGNLENAYRHGHDEVKALLTELRTEMPKDVSEYLRNNGQVEASEVQRVDLIALEARLNSSNDARFARLLALLNARNDAVGEGNTSSSASLTPTTEVVTGKCFTWGGKFSRLPESFKFPTSVPVKFIWDLYYFGEKHHMISPFRHLEYRDFPNAAKNNDVTYFSKCRCILSIIGVLAFKAGKFLIASCHISSTVVSREALERALGGTCYSEMCDIFQCGYEKLLGFVYSAGLRTDTEQEAVKGKRQVSSK